MKFLSSKTTRIRLSVLVLGSSFGLILFYGLRTWLQFQITADLIILLLIFSVIFPSLIVEAILDNRRLQLQRVKHEMTIEVMKDLTAYYKKNIADEDRKITNAEMIERLMDTIVRTIRTMEDAQVEFTSNFSAEGRIEPWEAEIIKHVSALETLIRDAEQPIRDQIQPFINTIYRLVTGTGKDE